MTGYLDRLLESAVEPQLGIQPRLAALFEPSRQFADALSSPSVLSEDGTAPGARQPQEPNTPLTSSRQGVAHAEGGDAASSQKPEPGAAPSPVFEAQSRQTKFPAAPRDHPQPVPVAQSMAQEAVANSGKLGDAQSPTQRESASPRPVPAARQTGDAGPSSVPAHASNGREEPSHTESATTLASRDEAFDAASGETGNSRQVGHSHGTMIPASPRDRVENMAHHDEAGDHRANQPDPDRDANLGNDRVVIGVAAGAAGKGPSKTSVAEKLQAEADATTGAEESYHALVAAIGRPSPGVIRPSTVKRIVPLGAEALPQNGPIERSEPTTTVHVRIGRVEVRAVPPKPPTPKRHPKAPVMSLDEYLGQQARGGGK